MFKSRNSHSSLMAVSRKPVARIDLSPLFGLAGFAAALAICFAIGF